MGIRVPRHNNGSILLRCRCLPVGRVRMVCRKQREEDSPGRSKGPEPMGAVRCARQCMGMVPRLVWAVSQRTRLRPNGTGLRNLPCNPRRRLEQPARRMPVRHAKSLHGRVFPGQERPGLSDRSRPRTAGSSRGPPCLAHSSRGLPFAARHAAKSEPEPAYAKGRPHACRTKNSDRSLTLPRAGVSRQREPL